MSKFMELPEAMILGRATAKGSITPACSPSAIFFPSYGPASSISSLQCPAFRQNSLNFHQIRRQVSIIVASTVEEEKVKIEPTTNVQFPTSILAPGGTSELSLIGIGYREKSIAFIKVKVYAIGMYVDASLAAHVVSWKHRTADELLKDASLFKAIAEAPMEKGIKIVLIRDVDGATFWGALDEAVASRLKASGAGEAGQEALNAFGEVFRGRSLKQGTSIYLTWVQPFELQVAVSGDSMVPASVEASIVSAALVSALFDVYLGENPVSPSMKMSTASGLQAML